jgi:hypothetical protein
MANEYDMQTELNSRFRTAAAAIGAAIGLAIGLTAFGYLRGESLYRPGSPRLPLALWVVILVCGLGAFVYRRFMFAGDRLRDIGVLRGTSGLLRSLQSTTLQLALIGVLVALVGFVIMIASGNKFDMVRAGAIAVIVMLYSFPQKSAWQRVANAVEKRMAQ